MRTNRLRIYSYPYLADFSSDYLTTQFKLDAVAVYEKEKNIIYFSLNYSINNEEIKELIATKVFKAIAQLSCKKLGYVKTVCFDSGLTSLKIDVKSLDVNDDVDINAYLVAEKDVVIRNNDLSKDWSYISPLSLKGNVIGESNVCVITVNHTKEGNRKSIVSFQEDKNLKDNDHYTFNLDGDRIVFGLSSKMHKQYSKIASKNEEQVISYFLIPTFSLVLESMIEYEDEENDFNFKYKNKEWYKVISHKYERLFNHDPVEGAEKAIVAAQKLLKVDGGEKNAISKSLDYIIKAQDGGIKND